MWCIFRCSWHEIISVYWQQLSELFIIVFIAELYMYFDVCTSTHVILLVLMLLVWSLQLLVGAWLNVLGAVGRIISTLFTGDQCRYAMLLTSQTVCACAQPFVMFSPTKLAAHWFHERQRTFANMIASIGTQHLYVCSKQRLY